MQGNDTVFVRFLQAAFGELNAQEDGSPVFTLQKPGRGLGYAMPRETLERTAGFKRNDQGLYVGTATMFPDKDGVLRNRQSQFGGLYFVVLDDIGTKCPLDELPEALRSPTWIIESSPGNFQYGYALDAPITDLKAAKALVESVYTSGPWDSGGRLPNKYVRLPMGVNVKEQHDSFQVRLVELAADRLFSPEDLLAACESTLDWPAVQEDATRALRDAKISAMGTLPCMQGIEYTGHGVVDLVLEWLAAEGRVEEDADDWVPVACPWHATHSDPSQTTAYYSPLGRGEQPDRRGFKCFHDSCSSHRTPEFLEWVIYQGGPEVPVHDPASALVSEWMFDMEGVQWIYMKSPVPYMTPDRGFRVSQQRKIRSSYVTPNGEVKWRQQSVYDVLLSHPQLVKVAGVRYEPGAPTLMDTGAGIPALNRFRLPARKRVACSAEVKNAVFDFLYYLIPDPSDVEWFLNHLAKKARDPKYRGNPPFMVANSEGTGRGTLERMIRQLWGEHNCVSLGAREVITGMEGGFNAYMQAAWVFIPELASSGGYFDRLIQSAALKPLFDPSPAPMVFRQKYGSEWAGTNYASVMVCSNETDGLPMDIRDRRIRFIWNTDSPRDAHWFGEFVNWLDSSGWEVEFWNYLVYEHPLPEDFGPQNMALEQAKVEEAARQGDDRSKVVQLARKWAIERYTRAGSRPEEMLALIVGYSKAWLDGAIPHDWKKHVRKVAIAMRLDRDVRDWERIVKRSVSKTFPTVGTQHKGDDSRIRYRAGNEGLKILRAMGGSRWRREWVAKEFRELRQAAPDMGEWMMEVREEAEEDS